jgi:hypothetical protein
MVSAISVAALAFTTSDAETPKMPQAIAKVAAEMRMRGIIRFPPVVIIRPNESSH